MSIAKAFLPTGRADGCPTKANELDTLPNSFTNGYFCHKSIS